MKYLFDALASITLKIGDFLSPKANKSFNKTTKTINNFYGPVTFIAEKTAKKLKAKS